jgi:hypothetical protein
MARSKQVGCLIALFLCSQCVALFTRAQPPSLDEIASHISRVRERYSSCSLEWVWIISDKKLNQSRSIVERQIHRQERDGARRLQERWHMPDGKTMDRALAVSHYLMVFDGSRSTMVDTGDAGPSKVRGHQRALIEAGLDQRVSGIEWPFDYYEAVWAPWGFQPIDIELRDTEWPIRRLGQERDHDGRSCHVIEFEQTIAGPSTEQKLMRRVWVDESRSWMPVREDLCSQETDGIWTIRESRQLSDFRLVDDTWVPFSSVILDPNLPEPPLLRTHTLLSFKFGDEGVRKSLIDNPINAPAAVRDGVKGVTYFLTKDGAIESEFPIDHSGAGVDKRMADYQAEADAQREATAKQMSARASRQGAGRGWSFWVLVFASLCVLTVGVALCRRRIIGMR